MKYGIIFNPKSGDEGTHSLINFETNEVIMSVGETYIDRWGDKKKRDMREVTNKLKELTCKDYIQECIEKKIIFKYKYEQYRFRVGGIACDGRWYLNCIDYINGSVARCTSYYDVTKLPTEIGTIIEE